MMGLGLSLRKRGRVGIGERREEPRAARDSIISQKSSLPRSLRHIHPPSFLCTPTTHHPTATMALRNVIHRRNHKERSQLTHRSKLGLLEKHKDYVLRAKDHHSKRDRIKRLREKAGDRNRDEFYFGMVRGKTEVSGVI